MFLMGMQHESVSVLFVNHNGWHNSKRNTNDNINDKICFIGGKNSKNNDDYLRKMKWKGII